MENRQMWFDNIRHYFVTFLRRVRAAKIQLPRQSELTPLLNPARFGVAFFIGV